ncbi:putative PTS-dependent dihydroxyacetone kinase, ADP-binding subunit DhaL [Fusobacterium varium]|nr:putative PTS-dependent dihydroxyacetone kinase, ADP-binding subunit DhaL [Fusobacterium varium]
MKINKEDIKKMFLTSCDLLKADADELSEIDSKFGDGDHGITIVKIANAIEKDIENWNAETSIKDFIDNLGMSVMGVNGGSAGPLWGSLISGLAVGIPEGAEELDEQIIKDMFAASLEEMNDVSGAKVGDKTMMDTFIPAAAAIAVSESDIRGMFAEAAVAAEKGCEDTKNYISKYGRAKSYKEKTLGFKDAGAVSMNLLFQGFAKSFE